eukprot:13278944-Ditylum_brightwellii.AAC.1
MTEAAEHVPFKLLAKVTRNGILLAAIKCSDADLNATMTKIRSNADETSVTNKMHYFELAATYLLPFCPVLRKFHSGIKCDAIKISDATVS